MASDDEVNEDTSFEPSVTPGPRRSTYTPPTAETRLSPEGAATESAGAYDDDELANALAADLGRFAPPTAPVNLPAFQPQSEPAPEPTETASSAPISSVPSWPSEPIVPLPPAFEAPVSDAPTVQEPVAEAPVFEAPVFEVPAYEAPAAEEPAWSAPPADVADAVAPDRAEAGAEVPQAAPTEHISAPPPDPSTAAADAPPPPPWSSLPAPDPSQAVDLGGPPLAPIRKSLPDDQLMSLADGQDAGAAIEQLENQLRLREQDAREFSAWESSMLALGTPDAAAAVAQARHDYSDIVPGPAAYADTPEPASAPEPAPIEEPVSADPPAPEPSAALPAWDVPPPSENWSPGPETGLVDLPVTESPAVETELPEVPVEDPADTPDSAEQVAEPEPQLVEEAELTPEEGAQAEPVDDAVPEPVLESDAEPEPEPESESESEEADDSFAPPPLVEPPVFAPPAVEDVDEGSAVADAAELVESAELVEIDEPAVAAEPVEADEPAATGVVDSVPIFEAPTAEPELPGDASSEPEVEIPELIEPGMSYAALSAEESVSDAADSDVVAAEIVEEEAVAAPGSAETESAETWVVPGAPAAASTFDDLVTGPAEPEPAVPPATVGPPSGAVFPEALFMPVAAGEAVPTETGSVSIIEAAFEEELDDDVDETDRIPVAAGAAVAGAILPPPIAPPSGPIATVRIPEDEVVIMDPEPIAAPVFRVEQAAVEPTPVDQRVGRAARQFWLWFAANSSVVSLGLGATVFAVGMSLRQSIVAILAGVALSFVPLGLTILAGKRSGQPTMVISRASFGYLGNIIPATIALIGRVFWGAVLLWLIASSVAVVLTSGTTSSVDQLPLLLISLGAAFVVVFVVALFGYSLLARVQLVLSILAAVLVIGFIALTAGEVNVQAALTVPDGSWLGVITGAVLVFSLIGLVWANSGADLARYQRPGSSSGGSMLWGTFGATLPSFLLVSYGALLAASSPTIAAGFLESPLETLALMLPSWYPIPLIAAAALSLLSGVIITLYSGGFALQSMGVRTTRSISVVIVGALLLVLSLVLTLAVPGGLTEMFRDAATTLAVPTAAWAGIFAAETMIRNRRFESDSLVARGGIYGDWRWVNVIGFVVITVLGFGLTTASVAWLGWQGYLFTALGVPLDGALASTDAGVLVALLLGLLLPIVAGIPAIRRQEELRAP